MERLTDWYGAAASLKAQLCRSFRAIRNSQNTHIRSGDAELLKDAMCRPLVDERAIPLGIAGKFRHVEVIIFSPHQKRLRASAHATEYLAYTDDLGSHSYPLEELNVHKALRARVSQMKRESGSKWLPLNAFFS